MCEVTLAAIDRSCGPNIPGGKNLYVANSDDVASITSDTDTWVASVITMEATKLFYKFSFDRNSLQHKEDELESGAVNGSLEAFFGKDTAAKRAQFRKMAGNSDLAVIYEDGNGMLKLIPNGVRLKRNYDTGKAGEDKNGYTATLVYEGEAAYTFTGTVPLS